ncbi:MAG: hypothetical protein ABMB14_40740 [Myxococcota bacterium]
MNRSFLAMAAWVAACSPESSPSSSAPTDTDPSTPSEPPPTSPDIDTATLDTAPDVDTGLALSPCAGRSATATGATTITLTSVTCNPTHDAVRYTVCVDGPTSGGVVFAQETANIEPNWSDAHSLDPLGLDPTWDELRRDLDTHASIVDWSTDVSTLFGCQAHFESPLVMSYAAAAYDATGRIADCVAWGGDPQAMIDGTVVRVNDPPFDLTGCRIAP